MNKIVNGVANDYEFPQLERITIPTESECYLGIIREYQREVERLNKIINELEKWLIEYDVNVYVLDKLKELKEKI